MRNLAGDKRCDASIGDELEAAGVEIIETDEPSQGEVAARLTGKLGAFTFTRAWYYWVVNGPLPVTVAEELYAHPVGKKDVRVAGHCCCPPPEAPWVEYFDADGKKLLPKDSDDYRLIQASHSGAETSSGMREAFDRIESRCRFVDDPKSEAVRAIVDCYHIDSIPGLILFCDALRKHGLAGKAGA